MWFTRMYIRWTICVTSFSCCYAKTLIRISKFTLIYIRYWCLRTTWNRWCFKRFWWQFKPRKSRTKDYFLKSIRTTVKPTISTKYNYPKKNIHYTVRHFYNWHTIHYVPKNIDLCLKKMLVLLIRLTKYYMQLKYVPEYFKLGHVV